METFGFTYGYLIATLILGCVWSAIFLLRSDLRSELLWMSILIAPAGLTERYFVPVYWNPGNLFNLIDKIGFGIESIAFSFFVGGVAGVSYEVFASKHLKHIGTSLRAIRFVPPPVDVRRTPFCDTAEIEYPSLQHLYSRLLGCSLNHISPP